MRILIVGINFSPELTGVGRYTGEMAHWLAQAGHTVRVVCAPPHYPQWRVWKGFAASRYSTELVPLDPDGAGAEGNLMVIRCPSYVPSHPGGVRRMLHVLSFTASALWPSLRLLRWKPDVIISIEPTLAAAPLALSLAKLTGAATVLHVQDLEVDAAFELGVLRSPALRGVVQSLERTLMRRFEAVSSISDRMVDRLIAKGVAPERTVIFPNWVDETQIFPLDSVAGVRSRFSLPEERFVALYAGSIGRKQGLENVIDAARLLIGKAAILFVIAGEGPGRKELELMSAGLGNVRFMDLQPEALLNELLNTADVHLLPQRAEAADLVLPSKLLGMMSSGRPVVATAEPGTQLHAHVDGRGVVVPPADATALAMAVERLCDAPAMRARLGAAARAHAREVFGKRRVLENWMRFVGGLVERRKSGGGA